MKGMKRLLFAGSLFLTGMLSAQERYTVANLHSHNDYEKPFPFTEAWNNGYGSIEADIFLDKGRLIVAHDTVQMKRGRTLDSLYLDPLALRIRQNQGFPYADHNRRLQLLIDIKRDSVEAMKVLTEKLRAYPDIIQCNMLQVVITGNRPPVTTWADYPSFIWFDGELYRDYPPAAMSRIVMMSDDFKTYAGWNGKGIFTAEESKRLDSICAKARRFQKKIRFWNAPDNLNAWYAFMRLGVDYINTDKTAAAASFMRQLPKTTYTSMETYSLYQPSYRNDGVPGKVKNIILLIGDGTGLPQWYSGYTANHGQLNIFNMHFTGLSKTSSYDSYITDSAPGSTAFSSGEKTNNRAVGVDHTGKALTLLPSLLAKKKMKTGLLTTGDITDATPADFYAHQSERTASRAIFKDLLQSDIDIIAGAGNDSLRSQLTARRFGKYRIEHSLDAATKYPATPCIIADSTAALSILQGRGHWLGTAFDQLVKRLSDNASGFFLMAEAAQVDHGGHENNLPMVATEVMDLDQLAGKAIQFADSNGETLVVVIADHETGGLTLTDGNIEKGYTAGQFSTIDHTALPVPVFAYGPGARLFTGVYENTAVFFKLLSALGMRK